MLIFQANYCIINCMLLFEYAVYVHSMYTLSVVAKMVIFVLVGVCMYKYMYTKLLRCDLMMKKLLYEETNIV